MVQNENVEAAFVDAEDAPPKIYVFSNVVGGGDGVCYAMAADGTVLASHWCSHEGYAPHDLGVNPGSRPDCHLIYAEHYPAGYEMEMVRASDVLAHPGLREAWRLNKLQGDGDAKSSTKDEAKSTI